MCIKHNTKEHMSLPCGNVLLDDVRFHVEETNGNHLPLTLFIVNSTAED